MPVVRKRKSDAFTAKAPAPVASLGMAVYDATMPDYTVARSVRLQSSLYLCM